MNYDESPCQYLLEPVFESRLSMEESIRALSIYNESFKPQKLLTLFSKENLLNNYTLNYFLKFGSIKNLASSLSSDPNKGLEFITPEILKQSEAKFGRNERKKVGISSLTWKVLDTILQDYLLRLVLLLFVVLLIMNYFFKYLVSTRINCAISIIIIVANFVVTFFKFFFWQIYFSKIKAKPSANFTFVIRNGKVFHIPSNEVVVGDLIQFKAGDMIEVDGIIVFEKDLEIDECDILDIDVSRKKVGYNFFKFSKKSHKSFILLSGSYVIKGEGTMLVCCVGKNTLLQRQAYPSHNALYQTRPKILEKNLMSVEKCFFYIGISICVVIMIAFFVMKTRELIESSNDPNISVEILEKVIIIFIDLSLIIMISNIENFHENLVFALYKGYKELLEKKIILFDFRIFDKLMQHITILMNPRNNLTTGNLKVEKVITANLTLNMDPNRIENQEDVHAWNLIDSFMIKKNELNVNNLLKEEEEPSFLFYLCIFCTLRKRGEGYLESFLDEVGFNIKSETYSLVPITKNNEKLFDIAIFKAKNKIYLFCKGPAKLIDSCSYVHSCHKVNSINTEVKDFNLDQIKESSNQMSRELLNVQIFAYKELSEYEFLSFTHSEINLILTQLTFLGMLGISDDLKENHIFCINADRKKVVHFNLISQLDSTYLTSILKETKLLSEKQDGLLFSIDAENFIRSFENKKEDSSFNFKIPDVLYYLDFEQKKKLIENYITKNENLFLFTESHEDAQFKHENVFLFNRKNIESLNNMYLNRRCGLETESESLVIGELCDIFERILDFIKNKLEIKICFVLSFQVYTFYNILLIQKGTNYLFLAILWSLLIEELATFLFTIYFRLEDLNKPKNIDFRNIIWVNERMIKNIAGYIIYSFLSLGILKLLFMDEMNEMEINSLIFNLFIMNYLLLNFISAVENKMFRSLKSAILYLVLILVLIVVSNSFNYIGDLYFFQVNGAITAYLINFLFSLSIFVFRIFMLLIPEKCFERISKAINEFINRKKKSKLRKLRRSSVCYLFLNKMILEQ